MSGGRDQQQSAYGRGASRRGLRVLRGALLILALCVPSLARAVGTPAGTAISNQATVDFESLGTPGSVTSAVDTFVVEELIDVQLVWQDPGPVTTSTPATDQVLTFLVRNVGNGSEQFAATFVNLLGDDFDVAPVALHVDADGDGLYTAGIDLVYAGPADLDLDSNDPTNDRRSVFIVGNIPAALANGSLADLELTATSVTGSGAPGSGIPGAGDGGTEAVFGLSGGDAVATGQFAVSDLTVTVAKSALVFDPFGGSDPMVGATIRYRLDVSVVGAGTALGLDLTDPVPANTTYTAGTLVLNGSGLTDAGGDDAGDFGVTTPGEVTVSLSDLTSASPVQTVTFDVTID